MNPSHQQTSSLPANAAAFPNQVRRRSSTDQHALAAHLLFLKEARDLENNDALKKKGPLGTTPSTTPPTQQQQSINWKSVIFSSFFAFCVGILVASMPSLLTFSPKTTPSVDIVDRCLQNITECPQLDQDTFSLQWKSNTNHNNKNNEHCSATCDFLFQNSHSETEGPAKANLACRLGCNFAELEHAHPDKRNCHYQCKNTVWLLFPEKTTCGYNTGLGLATLEFERKFGEGVFAVGKACEMGCIVGNSRPCPLCDQEAKIRATFE